ncbi:MAG: hypothetical protein JJU20_10365 [Opitutales bacterium]|nr:hypothetical protein [Opitutales bacterium]
MHSKIPVILVTGFLGSGKTTFLRRIAESHPTDRLIFLVNELAETDVDGDTLAATGTPTQSVIGGSLFCECKAADFVRIMRETVRPAHAEEPVEAVIIETSGMANPDAIGTLMGAHRLSADFEIRCIATVVAPAKFQKLLPNLPVLQNQIRSSDWIIINKTDTATAETVEAVEATIRALNSTARITRAEYCRCEFQIPSTQPNLPSEPLATCAANPFDTVSITWPADQSIETARKWLRETPADILRIKGQIETPEGHWHIERSPDGESIEAAKPLAQPRLVCIAHEKDQNMLERIRARFASTPNNSLP